MQIYLIIAIKSNSAGICRAGGFYWRALQFSGFACKIKKRNFV